MDDLVKKLGRERAVICGIAVAVLQAISAGTITRETAVPVIAGIVLRFLVSPWPPEGEDPATVEAVPRYLPGTRAQTGELAADLEGSDDDDLEVQADHADHSDPDRFHAGLDVAP